MDRVRVGVIGTGGIFYGWGGGSGHLPAFPWLEEAKLVALCDPSERALNKAQFAVKKAFEDKAKEVAQRGDVERAETLRRDASEVKLYTDYQVMLSETKPDLVDVISPAGTHASVCIEALQAGAHVMCEKPMACTWLDAMKISDAVAQSGKFFQYSENMLFADPWYVIKNCMDSGAIGETLLIYLPLAIGNPGNFSYARDKVGALLDMAIHAITLSWYLIGFDKKPVRVKAVDPHGIGIRMPNRQDSGVQIQMTVEDDAHFLVEYEDETTGTWYNTHLEGSWSYQDSPSLSVLGTVGSITTEGDDIKIIDAFGNARTCTPWHGTFLNQNPPLDYCNGHMQQAKNMCHCILNGIKPQCDQRVGAGSIAIAGAAALSQQRGRTPVTIEEFKAEQRKTGNRE